MPRFEPFAGLRYRSRELSELISPPYDVIAEPDRVVLEKASPHNAVHVELPRPKASLDAYAAASALFEEWQRPGGPLRLDDDPAFYVYRMSFADEAGRARSTTGVIGALGIEPPGEGDVLPHERTTPKAKSDRLDLLRATKTNTSPIWGLSLAAGLSQHLPTDAAPAMTATADGVVHELWPLTDAEAVEAIRKTVSSAPVVIADGHHRYEVAGAYAEEVRRAGAGAGPSDLVMAFVVELVEDQLSVAPIHRLVAGLAADFDLVGALDESFVVSAADDLALDGGVVTGLVEAGALAMVTGDRRWLLRARPETLAQAEHDLDSSVLDVALRRLPEHELTYQHGVDHVVDAVSSGAAQAGFLLRPATVEQIAAVAARRGRMSPKTTFFTPKPATGLVFRPIGRST